MFRFHKGYALLSIVLLLTEIAIAVFVHDGIVRPYIGDLLVVILIYCFIRSFFSTRVWKTAIAVLLFAYTLEILQYLRILELIGLGHSRFANIILGNAFAWMDMLMYTMGIAIVWMVEYGFRKQY